jgi:GrpB-like predicted nucleotidyltransferase (UPF0157 family)
MNNDALGMSRGEVILKDYDPRWAKLFKKEKIRIHKIIGLKILVEHIGSTAIPGIKAKPIMDLMVAVPSLKNWKKYKESLARLGYVFRQDFIKNEQHVLFVKGPTEKRTHYLKLTTKDSNFWKEKIAFRDYLISHPKSAKEYSNLKISLKKKFSGKRIPYTDGKALFVKKVLRLANKN